MVSDKEKTEQALKIAIQMEIDGKEYYEEAGRACDNELSRKLFISLAGEEDLHRSKFEEIYSAISSQKEWPVIDFKPDGANNLRTIFNTSIKKIGADIKAPADELEALEKAMEMESKTFDFYMECNRDATYAAEADFYEKLALEERGHHLVLLDYYEYLKDPAGWFVRTEHPSLDGG